MSDGGKGSKPRPIPDPKKFEENWDKIFGNKPKKESIYQDEKLRFLIDAAKAKISAWQTISKVGAEL